MTESDTIAAVSTATGEGGIGIVRISGNKALSILKKLFKAPGKKAGDCIFADRSMLYGHILDPLSSETVDEVLAVFMKGPHSYTGEDLCEIQCHGGTIPLRYILDLACQSGARPAQPGEFTKRAFLNGRIDLAQAGAVIDLIKSKTPLGYHAAKEQAEGKLSERVRDIRGVLLNVLAEIAVRIDYPEAYEEWEDTNNNLGLIISDPLKRAANEVGELLKGADAGRIVKDGIRAVIIGKPNVGKSSLFNAIVREDAAIVTEIPGTTRDSIEIWVDIDGIPVQLIDTAGIREEGDGIELLGIERTKEQYRKAEMSVFMLDGSAPLSVEDESIAQMLDPEKKLIVVIGKSDLPQAIGKKEAVALIPFQYRVEDVIYISLVDGEKMNDKEKTGELENRIRNISMEGAFSGASLLVTKAQHKAAMKRAADEIEEALEVMSGEKAYEFAEVNIRAAWEALGEIIGETASDEIINCVFEEFCVGK